MFWVLIRASVEYRLNMFSWRKKKKIYISIPLLSGAIDINPLKGVQLQQTTL